MSKTLQEEFANLPQGKISTPEQVKHTENVLMMFWDNLTLLNDNTSMQAYKLLERTEDLEWHPPLLSFMIERHGGTVCGSSHAELHKWTIDTSKNTATCQTGQFRQLKPMSKRYNPTEDVEEIVGLILAGKKDPRLKWKDDFQTVAVDIANIVPTGGSKQTEISRRKKFRKECDNRLIEKGWEVVRDNTYRRPYTDQEK